MKPEYKYPKGKSLNLLYKKRILRKDMKIAKRT